MNLNPFSDRSLEVPDRPGAVESDFRKIFLNDASLLDVRAPVEFAKGAFPESSNIALLDDEQRHEVGLEYKRAGQSSAIGLGAKLITAEQKSSRVASWKRFIDEHPDCIIYCFRGGLRSRIVQHWLAQDGVEVPLIKGGYKAMRTYLINTLAQLCESMSFVLIGGRTGNGKTLLLQQLSATVDLERLANHRGSSFGSLPGGQPGNIDFENALAIALMRLDDASVGTIYLEDEAKLIGRVCLPDCIRTTMSKAPLYILECDMDRRVRNCFEDYVVNLLNTYVQASGSEIGFEFFTEHHRASLARIRKRLGGSKYQKALELLNLALSRHQRHHDTSGYSEFIELLLSEYYDPMYDYQLSKKQQRIAYKGNAQKILRKINS